MKTIGQFEIIEKIGAGGMGVVYKAHDTRLRRTVALKLVSPDLTRTPAAAERQLREARAAAALNHPNIATVYEVGDADSGNFIAMEFIDGEILYRRVREGRIPLDKAVEWAHQLCDGIAAAHDADVVHRDIKSANVMITSDDRLKVLDFGLARQPDDSSGPSVTDTDNIVGTVDYMAPELLRGESATKMSDVFSIGVVMFEMLTGKLPFEGPAPVQVMYLITNEDAPPLSDFIDDAPDELNEIIQRAMAKNVADRHPTARELAEAIGNLAGRATGARATARPEPSAEIPTNLPEATTSFVGREGELEELTERVQENRLVMIMGPGGAGKTRVSIELARRMMEHFPDGVYQIGLAPLTEPEQVVPKIAQELGVREEPGRDLIDTVVDYLRPLTILLLLDNCEHLVDASARAVARILESAQYAKIVATSQHRLDTPGEVVWKISTLSLPQDDAISIDDVNSFEAIKLFIDRATKVDSGFVVSQSNLPAVVQICRALDGIPLSIELAAARVRLLSPQKILERLEDRFRLLTGGGRTTVPRHQTLRATVEWSLDLLDTSERSFFRRLSVFSGGASIEAIEVVCGDDEHDEDALDLLARLVDKSLVFVRTDATGDTRYDLLDTLREYGARELRESADKKETRRRHAQHILALAEKAEPQLAGPEQAEWLDRLDLEAENIRAAIHWLIRDGAAEAALRIGASVWRFWLVRGRLESGRQLLGKILSTTGGETATRAQALHGLGVLANDQGDFREARARFEECLEIRRSIGDRSGEAQTLNSLGIAARDQGDYRSARKLLDQGLTINREIGDESGAAMSIHALGITEHREGDCTAARKLFEEGLEIRKALGDRRGIAALLAHLGSVDHDLGRYDDAEPLLEEALNIFRELGNKRGIVFALMHVGGVAQQRAEFDVARSHYCECLNISRELGDKQHIVRMLEWMASLAAAEGEHGRSLELEGAAWALRESFGLPRTPMETDVLSHDLAPAHAALGREAATQARKAGRLHSLESAVELALAVS